MRRPAFCSILQKGRYIRAHGMHSNRGDMSLPQILRGRNRNINKKINRKEV